MTAVRGTVTRAPAPAAGARARRPIVVSGALVALVIACALSLAFGARVVDLREILDGLSSWVLGGTSGSIGAIAVTERVPRTLLAILAGAALGLSGALMQALTRNPLADPGILGVNTGAALAVVSGMAFLGASSIWSILGLAILGGVVTAVFVYAIGSYGPGGATPIKLALAGAATTAALSSLVSAVLLPRVALLDDFRFWQVGGVGGADWSTMAVVAPVLAAAALLGFLCAPALDALALGDDVAVGLGARVARTRLLAAIAGVLLCATTTAVAGPIAFVGLMVPHAVRLAVGPDQRWILPLSAAGGAVLLVLADTIGRVIGRPGEVDAGIITAFVGAPVLILIARRTRMVAL
ncbi:iron chelate uptake ABC transporter family permease subunit [Microbacterium betulae]|uniref:Iron chelate uptake ABC transporter family permease subunit n=1 Tax=Microbacterium betulae TaxID=2981139 RepID=A0AA97FFS3_9MICO|nr:iron chelate uptake ABC transporter family permease subunit [Microbacterium sp. AB]WOF21589.1 iron chelate uptake ABC transporter family permease subunit [Microbacterium sp. AB]